MASIDPFADEGDPLGGSNDVGSQQNYIHIRIQQRNGRKTLTTLQGLPKGECFISFCICVDRHPDPTLPRTEYDSKKLLKAFKKVAFDFLFDPSITVSSLTPVSLNQEFACNGTLVDDEEMGQVIQLQGDQRLKISNFLTENGIPKTNIKLHGF
jgi:translation initiation factor 1